jgi:hypothetical protein
MIIHDYSRQRQNGASKAQAKPSQGKAQDASKAQDMAQGRKGASKGARQASQDKPSQASQGRKTWRKPSKQGRKGARRKQGARREKGAPLTARL